MILTRRLLLASGALALAAFPNRVVALASSTIAARVGGILEASSTGSYFSAKLALDGMIAPYPASVARETDIFADAVRQMAGPDPSDHYKFAAIRRTIYERGLWNGNRPFSYDQADPFGRNVQNKLLSTYCRTRLGNCVSMPILLLILAERAGLNVGLATAPVHVFVRYVDSTDTTFNVEATSSGHFAREAWYRENMPMSNRAIESGIYMRTLTKRESVAVMASTVVDFMMDQRRYQDAVEVADAILAINSRDVYAMLKKGTAIAEILRIEFAERYPTPSLIPSALRSRYQMLAAQNAAIFRDAEALGWRPRE